MQNVNNIDAIRLLKHKNFVDVFKHYLIVVSLSMKFGEVRVKIE